MTAPRSAVEIVAQADALADLTESDGDDSMIERDGAPVRSLRAAFTRRPDAAAAMMAAAGSARGGGYSWAVIGSLMRTPRQATRETYRELAAR